MWRKRLKWAFFGWVAGSIGVGLVVAAFGITGPLGYLLILGTWVAVGVTGYEREIASSTK